MCIVFSLIAASIGALILALGIVRSGKLFDSQSDQDEQQ